MGVIYTLRGKRMIRTEKIENIAKAIVKAKKDMIAPVKSSNNPFFKSKYADINAVLEACTDALHENDITILQPTVYRDGASFVQTLLFHESGEYIGCETEIKAKDKNNPQAEGSGITYARRYGLQSLLGLGAEDDDGNMAAKKPKKYQNTEQNMEQEKQGLSGEQEKYLNGALGWLAKNASKAGKEMIFAKINEWEQKQPFLVNHSAFQRAKLEALK